MAQHARPNVAGNTDRSRAHWTRSSSRAVRKLWGICSSPMPLRRLLGGLRRVEAVASGVAVGTSHTVREPGAHLADRTPVDRAGGEQVAERDEQHEEEDAHHDEAVGAERLEDG